MPLSPKAKVGLVIFGTILALGVVALIIWGVVAATKAAPSTTAPPPSSRTTTVTSAADVAAAGVAPPLPPPPPPRPPLRAGGAVLIGPGTPCAVHADCGDLTGLVCENRECTLKKRIGERCDKNSECNYVAGDICVLGFCSRPGGEGSPCAVEFDCSTGMACGADNKCVKRAAEGEKCAAKTDCQIGLTCITGKCTKLRQVGEVCTGHRDCDYNTRLYCDETTRKCASSLSLHGAKKTGQMCAYSTECGSGSICDQKICVPINYFLDRSKMPTECWRNKTVQMFQDERTPGKVSEAWACQL